MMRALRACAAIATGMTALVIPATSAHALGRPCATGELHVAVVVDFGTGGSVAKTCVPAGSRDSGAQVLAARASMLGRAQPRYNSAGLLCAIDGYPATGCGVRSGSSYAYWAYYRSTNGNWSYSSVGPAFIRVKADVVEGWRWHPAGSGNPSDPAPRASANPAATCTPSAPPTTARPASAPPTVPVSPAGKGPTGTSPPAVNGVVTPATGPDGTPSQSSPSTATAGSAAGVTTTIGGKVVPSTTPKRGATTTTDAGAAGNAVAAPIAPKDDGGGGAPIGLLVGGLLVAGLAAGGVIAARRRARVAT